MEIAVRIPPNGDFFSFDSPCSSHYLTAPSSPHRFTNSSISAPTSPSHASNFFRLDDDDDDVPITSPSSVPFRWEEKPGIPKSPKSTTHVEDFEFNFSGQFSDQASLSADELFHGGRIKPLKPPPGFLVNDFSSTRSPQNSKLSPRRKNHEIEIDPFEAAIVKETKRSHSSNELDSKNRGRERNWNKSLSSNFVRKETRSLSPFRVSESVLNEEEEETVKGKSPSKASSSSFLSLISFSKGNRKWRIRDLLFRSVSEGRGTEKDDRLRKYTEIISKKEEEDDEDLMNYGGGLVSEELKKKKQGIFGCLRLNRTGMLEISRGMGSLTRG